MTMEEYLRNGIQNELGSEKGTVKVEIREAEHVDAEYLRWIIEIEIQHKDIIYTYSNYLDDVVFGRDYLSKSDIVTEYEIYVKKELLKRFYSEEES